MEPRLREPVWNIGRKEKLAARVAEAMALSVDVTELETRAFAAEVSKPSDEQLVRYIKEVLDPETIEELQEGFVAEEVRPAVEAVDNVIKESKTDAPLVLYRGYNGIKSLPPGFKDGAFWVGSETKPKADVVIKRTLPASTNAIDAGNGYWIMARSQKPTLVELSLDASTIEFNSPKLHQGSLTEFHLPSKHDQSSHGRGGGGGTDGMRAAKRSPEEKAALKKKIILGAKVVVAVAAVSYLGYKGKQYADAKKVHTNAVAQKEMGSKEDAEAQDLYTLQAGVFMNQRRRGNKIPPGRPDGITEETIDATMKVEVGLTRDELGTRLDAAFKNNSVNTNGVTVYRGQPRTKEWVGSIKEGEIISDKGFTSTTINPKAANNYARDAAGTSHGIGGDAPVVMTIKTKKGTKVMSGIDMIGNEELVMNSEQPLKITRVRHCPDGVCRITAEAVE